MKTRKCRLCGRTLPLNNDNFPYNSKRDKYGYYCKPCHTKKAKEYSDKYKYKDKVKGYELGKDTILIGSGTGIIALLKAIFNEEFMLPEEAIANIYRDSYQLTDEDTKDMITMRKDGMTFKKIGEIYDLVPSSIYRRIERYNKRKQKEVIE